jgi:hypothetical protein
MRHRVIGQVEYRWPISCGEESGGVLEDEDLLALLGGGDLRDRARDLAMTVPAAELRAARMGRRHLRGRRLRD